MAPDDAFEEGAGQGCGATGRAGVRADKVAEAGPGVVEDAGDGVGDDLGIGSLRLSSMRVRQRATRAALGESGVEEAGGESGIAGPDIGFEGARLDENDLNAEGFQFVAEGFGPAFEGELGGGVAADAGEAQAAGDGGDHDDVAEALAAELGQEGAGNGGGAEEVGVELLAKLGVGNVIGKAGEGEAGVVDEGVEGGFALFNEGG